MSDDTAMDKQAPNLEMSVMSLAREVWILTDRIMMLEDLLSEAGVVNEEGLKNYIPSAERQAEIDKKSREFVAEMVRASGVKL